jgi:hypothetical protein
MKWVIVGVAAIVVAIVAFASFSPPSATKSGLTTTSPRATPGPDAKSTKAPAGSRNGFTGALM